MQMVEHWYHSLFICLLKNRYLMRMQCELISDNFSVFCGQVYFLLKVLMPKMLVLRVPTLLVLEVLMPRLAMPGVLEAFVL